MSHYFVVPCFYGNMHVDVLHRCNSVGMHRIRTSPSGEYSFVACAYICFIDSVLCRVSPRKQTDDALKFCKSMHQNLGCVLCPWIAKHLIYMCSLLTRHISLHRPILLSTDSRQNPLPKMAISYYCTIF
jgi:hypothetical protein